MDLLDAAVQPYEWGSRHIIAELRGREVPSAGPEAELWMGAHPSGPSGIVREGRDTDLRRVVEADPEGELGVEVAGRFGGRLPYLLKVLAAQKALSIQVHPDRDRARAGFAAQLAAGLPDDSADRNYVDDWPKPEVLLALTPFEVLAGLRERADALDLCVRLDTEGLADVVAALRDEALDDDTALVEALRRVVTTPQAERAGRIEHVLAACRRLVEGASGDDAVGPRHQLAAEAALRIAADHPGDIGVVAALLLRHRVLRPGEAIFMAAGGLHAYVQGAGIEILANSDNVLRAGLTRKHVDVEELLDVVDPSVAVPLLSPRPEGPGVLAYDAPVPEFRLYRVALEAAAGAVPLPGRGPRIALVVEGRLGLQAGEERLDVVRGQSVWVPSGQPEVDMCGEAVLVVAAPGT